MRTFGNKSEFRVNAEGGIDIWMSVDGGPLLPVQIGHEFRIPHLLMALKAGWEPTEREIEEMEFHMIRTFYVGDTDDEE